MAKIPVFRRLSDQDAPDSQPWVSNMFNNLNIFIGQTQNALQKNLNFDDNVQGQKLTATFTTDTAYATGTFVPIKLNYTGGGIPTCLFVGQVNESTGATILTPVMVTSWNANINVAPLQVNIYYIAGLTAGKRYTVTFLAL